jgi:hypothetical protein
MLVFGLASLLMVFASRDISLESPPALPTHVPHAVRVSFGIFIVSLFLAGGALVLRMPVSHGT